MADAPPLSLVIERRFNAPIETVFDALTNPDSLVGWWGPEGFSRNEHHVDLRPGGSWRLSMTGPDGTTYVNGGIYREVTPPRRIVMTYGWEEADGSIPAQTLVTMELSPGDGWTDLRLEQSGFEAAESREGHRHGWSEALSALGQRLDSFQTSTRNPAP